MEGVPMSQAVYLLSPAADDQARAVVTSRGVTW